ncbi:MAG: 4-alpha-glucanotransferase, partial [Deltaproteobacteria bacterium]
MPDRALLADRARVTGVTIPLFSLRTDRSWGIGEINDLPEFGTWMLTLGIQLVQILPLGEIGANETSPYSALSAFGIDPMYISLSEVPDLPESALSEALGGDDGLKLLEAAKTAAAVDYAGVRALKNRALRFAFERFKQTEHGKQTPRDDTFDSFMQHEHTWLDDYALFRALKDAHGGKP